MNLVDPDGRDGMVRGAGTKNNPYVIVAVYLYDSTITQDQLNGLNAAIAEYNNSCTKVRDETGNTVYVSFELSSRLSENPAEERLSTNFKDVQGNPRYYGNIVTAEIEEESGRYGYATMMEIGFSEGMIGLGIEKGMDSSSLYKGVAIHEIGHNLGGEHEDGTSVMQQVEETIFSFGSDKQHSVFTYPSFSTSFVKKIFKRKDSPRENGSARIWTEH